MLPGSQRCQPQKVSRLSRPPRSSGLPERAPAQRFKTMLVRSFIALVLACAVPTGAASAGENPPAATSAVAPYEGEMKRLAGILGALQYPRGQCGGNDGQTWRHG